MSNPEREEASIANLSDDYIHNLKPESQRYDITLAQDFVISVLPNGIKTWAFIYDFQGRHRRKTLGVFPDMNFEEARVALEQARTAIVRMDEPTVAPDEFGRRPAVLGGGHYVPKGEPSQSWGPWFKFFSGLLLIGLLAVAYYMFKNRDALTTPTQAAPNAAPFELDQKETQDTPDRTTIETPPPEPTTTQPEAASITTSQPIDNTAAREPTSAQQNNNVANNAEIRPQETPPQATNTSPPVTAQASTPTTPNTGPSPTESSSPEAVDDSGSSEPTTQVAAPAQGATAYGGSVVRSALTSKVENLEPTDRLGPEISYQDSSFIRVFYFTELREFSDGIVVHRWELNGRVMEEVELKVQESWRWRTYSNKDITPGLTGEWSVSTIDATGTVLDRRSFTYDY